MIGGLKKKMGREKPIEIAGPSVQWIVETQMEVVEAENASLCPHRRILHDALTVECPSLEFFLKWTLQPVKIEIQDDAHPIKWSQMIYYLICLPDFLFFRMTQKSPSLTKYTFQKVSLPYQK